MPYLSATLARSKQHYPYLSVRRGTANGQGWVLTPLLAQAPATLRHLLVQLAARHGTTDHRYLASQLLIGHVQHLSAVGILSILLDGRLPMLGLDSVAMQWTPTGEARAMALLSPRFWLLPDDRAANHPDAIVLADVGALWQQLSRDIQAHASQLIPPLHEEILSGGGAFGPRGLWLMLADQVASQAIYLAKAVGHAHESPLIVEAILGGAASPLRAKTGVLEIVVAGVRDYFVARSSCCLIHVARDGVGRPLQRCQTCPAYSLADRRERLTAYVRRPHP